MLAVKIQKSLSQLQWVRLQGSGSDCSADDFKATPKSRTETVVTRHTKFFRKNIRIARVCVCVCVCVRACESVDGSESLTYSQLL